MRSYYFDYAAATPISRQALKEYNLLSSTYFANTSSMHDLGLETRDKLEEYRKRAAKLLNCFPEEIIFTSGGTESNFIAIAGTVQENQKVIISSAEHKSVLEICKQKTKHVFQLEVDNSGIVKSSQLKNSITKKTALVSIHYVNNETGVVQDIIKLRKLSKAASTKVLFHTDACQASLLDLDVKLLGVDMLTLNSNKCYGPKGVGLLFKSKDVTISPILVGGGQEFGLRSGTHNLPAIGAFIVALEHVQKNKQKILKHLTELRAYFLDQIKRRVPNNIVNDAKENLPSIINVGFKGVDAEQLQKHLSNKGIATSLGSACTAGKVELSHVLKAMHVDNKYGYIRISFGKDTTKKEIDFLIIALTNVVDGLRNI